MKNSLCLFVLLLACLRLPAAGAAADFEAARLNAVAANPPGVSLTLSLPPGRTQFRQGEVIPLTATFASRLPKAYRLNAGPGLSGSGDRELPWNSDAFSVDATAGATDPLAAYYAHELAEAYSGGGPQFQDLTAQPVAIPYTLNEWLRFDAPGRYRVYLTSGRVVDAGRVRPGIFRFQGRATASNAVELEILPDDPALDAKTLQEALPLLNEEGFHSNTQIARQDAVRAIRFLGTPDAARAMVARYGKFTDYRDHNYFFYRQTRLGLYGFPQPSVVIQEMQRRLDDPDFPVFSIFLEDMAQTQFFAAFTQPLPPYPAADPVRIHQWNAARFHFPAVLAAITEQNRQSLALAVDAKRGKARAISLYTLLRADYAHPETAEYAAWAKDLVPVFDDLTPEEQNNLLGDDLWCRINKPVLPPLLRHLYARPSSPDLEPGMFEGNEKIEFYSLTLRRLTELSPAEGRALLLAEIKAPRPRVDLPTLCSLPDRTLPALDDTLAAKIESCLQNRGSRWYEPQLVRRYATQAVLPRVKAAYKKDDTNWGTDGDPNLLAYFLRTDRAYGVKQMEAALASRTGQFHYRYILSDVAALIPNPDPDIERLTITHLHDPDPEVVVDAAKTLGTYGSSAAEAPLWARMREWHQQEVGKAEQITSTSGELEYVLSQALATAPGWLADRAKLQTLQSLCVTEGARGNIAGFLQRWTEPIRISFEETRGEWSVVQYGHLAPLAALEAKLAQFPRGTRFRLSAWTIPIRGAQTQAFKSRGQQMQAFKQLKPFLEKRGMQIDREPLPTPPPF